MNLFNTSNGFNLVIIEGLSRYIWLVQKMICSWFVEYLNQVEYTEMYRIWNSGVLVVLLIETILLG